jgi:hypothetical protein
MARVAANKCKALLMMIQALAGSENNEANAAAPKKSTGREATSFRN